MFLFQVAYAAVKAMLNKDNRATVYIWDSSLSPLPEKKSAGHVALELCEQGKPTLYHSLWPDRMMGVHNMGENARGVISRDYAEDVGKEGGRDAEHRIVFYNVNFPLKL